LVLLLLWHIIEDYILKDISVWVILWWKVIFHLMVSYTSSWSKCHSVSTSFHLWGVCIILRYIWFLLFRIMRPFGCIWCHFAEFDCGKSSDILHVSLQDTCGSYSSSYIWFLFFKLSYIGFLFYRAWMHQVISYATLF
jgi:hypothetical protein